MSRRAPQPAPRDIRKWATPKWVPIAGRPGWHEDSANILPDGSRPKMFDALEAERVRGNWRRW